MAISLCSALVLVTLSQAPPPPVAPTDSLATLRGRTARDSSDAQLWLLMGRAYLGLGVEAHGATHRSSEDSVWTRAVLDTAEEALGRAAALAGPLGSSAVGDSARVFRVGAWAARSWLGWEAGGVKAGVEAWGPLPMDLRVPPVLDELGENLLRACPAGGVLLTAGDADFYAAWYMRFARGLRPDLLVLPLAAWRSDAVLRAGLMADLKLGRRGGGDDAWLAELVRRRPVCVSMAFARPPVTWPRIRWETRPLVWVAGPEGKSPRVSPRDFVFVALRLALDGNRGEIALRIIRAGHEEGLEAVAVYSEVDRLSPHVRAADLAVPLGSPTAAESYLDIGKLVAAAQSSGCQAVHPGYGFLSERAPFAEAVAAASLEFIGPPAAAIRAMGDKTEARRRMQQAGVPVVPGTAATLRDAAEARREAKRIGYPVMLKAAVGGGGKGMRLVKTDAEVDSAFQGARS